MAPRSKEEGTIDEIDEIDEGEPERGSVDVDSESAPSLRSSGVTATDAEGFGALEVDAAGCDESANADCTVERSRSSSGAKSRMGFPRTRIPSRKSLTWEGMM